MFSNETLVDRLQKMGDFVRDQSGAWTYWPQRPVAPLNSAQLRMVANELDFRNRPEKEPTDKMPIGVSVVDAANCSFLSY